MQRHGVTMPSQRLDKRLDLDTFKVCLILTGLIGDNYIEICEGLAEQAG
jgi:hypothetical protein